MSLPMIHLRLRKPASAMAIVAAVGMLSVSAQDPGDEARDSSGVGESESRSSGGKSFEDFKLILQRNIFDPERRPYREPVREERPAPPPSPSPDRLRLYGTSVHDGGAYAWFDGTEPGFKQFKAGVGTRMGAFEITGITLTNVALKAEDKKFELAVGGELQRVGNAPWKASGGGPMGSFSRSPSNSGSTASPASESSGGSSEASEMSDVLKRLLEKRKKELNK